MKYVCDLCGSQLSVDRDLDDDRTFEYERNRHLVQSCPRKFTSDESAESGGLPRYAEQRRA